jgi:hypothetical protein
VEPLTAAEELLIERARIGEMLRFGKQGEDIVSGSQWGPDRTIRAQLIRELCTQETDTWPAPIRGVQLCRAKICGDPPPWKWSELRYVF